MYKIRQGSPKLHLPSPLEPMVNFLNSEKLFMFLQGIIFCESLKFLTFTVEAWGRDVFNIMKADHDQMPNQIIN